jgi:hypothetical protein
MSRVSGNCDVRARLIANQNPDGEYGRGALDQGLAGGLAWSASQSENRESRVLVYRDIENAETPTEVWLRSYKRWSYGS